MVFLARWANSGFWPTVLLLIILFYASLVIPLMNIPGGAIIAMLAMQYGAAAVFRLIVVSGICIAAFSFFAQDSMLFWVSMVWVGYMIMEGATGWIVHNSGRMESGLQVLALIAIAVCMSFYGLMDDPVGQWEVWLKKLLDRSEYETLSDQAGWPLDEMTTMLAPNMPGLTGAIILLHSAGGLILGRFWQSRLFRPGAFSREFLSIGFRWQFGAVLVGCALIAMITGMAIMRNTSMVLVGLLAIQGLAIIHAWAAYKGIPWVWIGMGYASMIFLFPLIGIIWLFLAALAVIDSWTDIRARLGNESGTS